MSEEPAPDGDYADGYHDGYIDALKEIVNGDILDPLAHLTEMLADYKEEE